MGIMSWDLDAVFGTPEPVRDPRLTRPLRSLFVQIGLDSPQALVDLL